LNEWTIKKNYPLPLILDVLENIGMKKVFTKMDLRWGYNNVRIKEGDEWKVAFTTPERSFESTVMFFGLTNSLAMFQAIMNKLLRDLINTGKVAAFIDDVIVGTETEEGHNEIVAEVIRGLEENDLYIKPEKYKWKVSIVAITHWNGTRDMLTSAKLSVGYLVVGITRELDKELLLHCSSIYINTRWSVLQ